MKTILIIGASGYIGYKICKELNNFYRVYGTFFSNKNFNKNKNFFHYDINKHDITKILKSTRPNLIISSLRGDFKNQFFAHDIIIEYVKSYNCRILFLSSSNVFDAFHHYPSYEYDKTLSESNYGKIKISIENKLFKLNPSKYVIARLPMIFGKRSPRIEEIKFYIKNNIPIDVYPNTIININSDLKLSQQIQYIINKKLSGIFHLGCRDLISHYDVLKLITKKVSNNNKVVFKHIYTTNQLRYIAVLAKKNNLPEHLNFNYESVLSDIYISKNYI